MQSPYTRKIPGIEFNHFVTRTRMLLQKLVSLGYSSCFPLVGFGSCISSVFRCCCYTPTFSVTFSLVSICTWIFEGSNRVLVGISTQRMANPPPFPPSHFQVFRLSFVSSVMFAVVYSVWLPYSKDTTQRFTDAHRLK